MNADELVRALRCCSNPGTRKPDCDSCPLFSVRLCVKEMLEDAAALIESLQAQLADAQRREDAAVKDLNALRRRSGWKCFACKHDAEPVREVCGGCGYNNGHNWEWRGPQEEDGE